VRVDDPWHDTPNYGVPYTMFGAQETLAPFFAGIAGVGPVDRSNVIVRPKRAGDGPGFTDPEPVHFSMVSGNYFPLLGLQARLGRTFTADDDRRAGGHPVAVISHRYWERRLGGDAEPIGRIVAVNGTAFTIIGVMPANFTGHWVGRPTDVWVPAAMWDQVVLERPIRQWNLAMIGRLKPGADRGQAQAAAQALFQRVRAEISGARPGTPAYAEFAQYRVTLESMAAGYSPQREIFAQPVAILAAIVGLVLLIACANVSNLLLARSAARRREIAVRLAIGASAKRIVRQLLTESVLLAALGGAAGVLVAYWGTGALAKLVRSGPAGFNAPAMSLDVDLHPDSRALLFTGALCLLTGLLFGMAPAWRSARASLAASFGARGAAAGGLRMGKALAVMQVAASLVLLTAAGLFVRTLHTLKSQDLGLDREHVLLVWTAPMQTGRTGAVVAPLFEKTRDRLRAVPGVVAASASVYGFLNGSSFIGADVKVQGYAAKSAEQPVAQLDIVLPGYFETLGMRLMAGRDFSGQDAEKAPKVVIVNESLARHFFGGVNAIGRRIGFGGNARGNEYEIVGVVSDAKHITPRDQARMMHYKPYRQDIGHLLQMCVAVRTVGDPARAAGRIREALREVDATLPVVRIETIDEQLDDLLGPERLVAALSGFLGVLALVLVCVGLYGLMSYNTLLRTNEIGIRMAMGATSGRVLGMVLREGALLVLAGTAIGLPVTLLATRLIASRLYAVGPADPATIAGAALAMMTVAAAAGWIPARRSSRVDPVAALRGE
jgi:putative ABC transport system permease protein